MLLDKAQFHPKAILKTVSLYLAVVMAAILAGCCLMWFALPNPHQDIELLAKPERYEPVFAAGVVLLDQMQKTPNENFIYHTDPRVGAIKRAFMPVQFVAVGKQGDTILKIHAGGGFGHYGYFLELDAAGTYVLTLFLEDAPEETKVLKRTAASSLPLKQGSVGTTPAGQAPSQP